MNFVNSDQYWNKRYKSRGNSGPGSYGNLAYFKATVLNNFVKDNDVESVIEFGCGDGNQLSLASYPSYCGYDVSTKSIELCREKFKHDKTKTFKHVAEYDKQKYNLSISLDVIYHLVEDEVYYNYMQLLFLSSNRYVIIYSSNDKNILSSASHVRHRTFTNDVPSDYRCIKIIKNIYPYNPNDKKNTSFSDFYIFRK